MSSNSRMAVYGVLAVVVLIGGVLLAWHFIKGTPQAPGTSTTGGGTVGISGTGGGGLQPATTGGPAGVPSTSPEQVQKMADEGLEQAKGSNLLLAQAKLSDALRAGIDGDKGKQVRDALNTLGDRIQLSNQRLEGDPYSEVYTVVQGDSLDPIARKYKITSRLITRINNLSSNKIFPDQPLKVIKGPVSLVIFKGRHELQVWLDKVCLHVYPIGIGADNKITPEGEFKLLKPPVPDPPYQPRTKPVAMHKAGGAPDNPLGSRWLDIGGGYGIHGTIDDSSIGQDKSEGCIRMHNKDVEEVADMVVSLSETKTKVTIHP
jgi:LysM repeat protein